MLWLRSGTRQGVVTTKPQPPAFKQPHHLPHRLHTHQAAIPRRRPAASAPHSSYKPACQPLRPPPPAPTTSYDGHSL